MSLFRDSDHRPQDASDLVAAVHHQSLHELEQLARAERARVIGSFIWASIRAIANLARSLASESRAQLAAEAIAYRRRRNLPLS